MRRFAKKTVEGAEILEIKDVQQMVKKFNKWAHRCYDEIETGPGRFADAKLAKLLADWVRSLVARSFGVVVYACCTHRS